MILENMLSKIREFWQEQSFEFYNYQAKAQLIKNWQISIEKSEEDYQNLQSMKLSPSYKFFESQISQWTERVFNLIQVL